MLPLGVFVKNSWHYCDMSLVQRVKNLLCTIIHYQPRHCMTRDWLKHCFGLFLITHQLRRCSNFCNKPLYLLYTNWLFFLFLLFFPTSFLTLWSCQLRIQVQLSVQLPALFLAQLLVQPLPSSTQSCIKFCPQWSQLLSCCLHIHQLYHIIFNLSDLSILLLDKIRARQNGIKDINGSKQLLDKYH